MFSFSTIVKCVFTKVIKGWAKCIFLSNFVLFICFGLIARPSMNSSQEMKAIIIDDFHPVLSERLSKVKIPFTYLPDISKEDALQAIRDFEIVIVRSKITFTKKVIESLPNLICIARGGAGMDNIDEEAAAGKGITLINAPEGNRDAVAEHAIGLILNLSNRIMVGDREVKRGIWKREENRGFEIGRKTIGIIGFGNTGQALAKKLSGFGCHLITYDKYHPSADPDVLHTELKDLQKISDIISLHLPLTNETSEMVNDVFLSHCKTGFILVNTSRGKIVNQNAVLRALKSGKTGAYATDVLENENFASYTPSELQEFNELAGLSNVLMTPHIAGWTTESYLKIAEVIADKVFEFTTK